MKLLALDTSTDHLTLAVLEGEKVLGHFHKKIDRNHSKLLVPEIGKLLKKTRLKIKDIDAFCIGVGPGSFTGLRIGVTVVKGLSYSLDKPIIAVPTFDAIAQNAKGFEGIICPVLDARKNKVYACLYRSDAKGIKRISKYLLLPAKELMENLDRYDKVLLLGDGVGLLGKTVENGFKWHPRAEAIGKLALEMLKKKKFTTAEDLEPMYLYSRECDVTGK
jgi:tRNA threonylcarbamoyladenosine biosynthesis protein TsaB